MSDSRPQPNALSHPAPTGRFNFQNLVEHTQEVFFRYRIRPNPALEYVNSSVQRLTGYSPAELFRLSDPFTVLVHPDDRALWLRILAGTAASEPIRLRWLHRDGAVIWVEQEAVLTGQAESGGEFIEGLVRHISPAQRPFNMLQSTTGENHPLNLTEVSAIIGQEAQILTGANRLAVFGLNGSQHSLWSSNLSSAYLNHVSLQRHRMLEHVAASVKDRFAGEDGIYTTGELRLIPNVEDLDDNTLPRLLAEAEGIRAIAIAPIRNARRLIGALGCYYDHPHHWSTTEIDNLKAFTYQAALSLENARLYEELEDAYLQMVLTLAQAISARDRYTAEHSQRLVNWAEQTAARFQLSTEEVQMVRYAALLHDIGKIGVPDEILRKNGPLTEEEWRIMRQHPIVGAEILSPVKKLRPVSSIIRHHQEKYDGSGYPDGLAGEDIPLACRILTVIDAFGAMTDDRVYRKARTRSEATAELWRCVGTHFDRQVVETFSNIIYS